MKAVYTATEKPTEGPIEVSFTALLDKEYHETYGKSIRFETVGLQWETYHNWESAEAWASIADYTIINGKTVTEINAGITSGQKLTLMMQPGGTFSFLRIYIPEAVMSVEDVVTMGILAGWTFENDKDEKVYTCSSTVYFYNQNGTMVEKTEYLFANDITIGEAYKSGTAGELYLVDITSSAWNSACDAFDYNYPGYISVRQNLFINGVSVHTINTTVDDSAYVYSSSPMNNTATWTYEGTTYDQFMNPVLLHGKGDTLTLWIHKDYIDSLEADEITITLGVGFVFVRESAMLLEEASAVVITVGEGGDTPVDPPIDPQPPVDPDVPVEDVVISFGGADIDKQPSAEYPDCGLSVRFDTVGEQWKTPTNSVLAEDWASIADYTLINGKTVTELNAAITSGEKIRITLQSAGSFSFLRVFIPETVMPVDEVVTMAIKEGWSFNNGTANYVADSSVYFYKKNDHKMQAITSFISADDITISEARVDGKAGELYKVDITFTGMQFDRGDYDFMYAGFAAQRVTITINGVSVYDINKNTNDSAYVYSTFPMTGVNDEVFAHPVIFETPTKGGENVTDKLTVWIHKNYIESLGVNVDVVVGVEIGFAYNGVGAEATSATVMTIEAPEFYTVTVNGVEQKVVPGELAVEPERPADYEDEYYTYTFKGWFIEGSDEEFDFSAPIYNSVSVVGKIEKQTKEGVVEYTVTVDGNAQAVVEGQLAVKPADPVKEEDNEFVYEFKGWFVVGTEEEFDFEAPVMADVEVESRFTATAKVDLGYSADQFTASVEIAGNAEEYYSVTIQLPFMVTDTEWNWQYGAANKEGEDPNPAYIYISQSIYINDVSVLDINKNTDDSEYVYSTWPSAGENAADPEIFQRPVILHNGCNNNVVEVRIHKDYVASLDSKVVVLTISNEFTYNGYPVYENVDVVVYRGMVKITVEGEEVEVAYGLPIEGLETPVKESTATTKFVFIGWFLKDTDEEFDIANTPITESIELVAKFEEQERAQYTVVIGDAEPVQIYEGSKLTAPTEPTKEATTETVYTFVGWYVEGVDTTTTDPWDFENDVVEGDLKLVAMFKESARKYTVSFGDYANDKTVKYGATLTRPSKTPTMEATEDKIYKFIGWFNGDDEWDFAKDTVKGDMTLLPKFEEITRTYTVFFDEFDEVEVEYGECVEEPEAPEMDGKVFIGWFYEDEEWDFDTEITEDIELEARWEDAEEDDENEGEDEDDDNQQNNNNGQVVMGCFGTIGGGLAAIMLPVAAAIALKKKRKENNIDNDSSNE